MAKRGKASDASADDTQPANKCLMVGDSDRGEADDESRSKVKDLIESFDSSDDGIPAGQAAPLTPQPTSPKERASGSKDAKKVSRGRTNGSVKALSPITPRRKAHQSFSSNVAPAYVDFEKGDRKMHKSQKDRNTEYIDIGSGNEIAIKSSEDDKEHWKGPPYSLVPRRR